MTTKVLVYGRKKDESYFVKKTHCNLKRNIRWIIKELDFLIDDIYICPFGRHVFKKKSAFRFKRSVLPLSDLFLYSYNTDQIQERFRKNKKKLSCNLITSYTHDVLSLYNSRFGYYVEYIYSRSITIEIEIQYIITFASYPNLLLTFASYPNLHLTIWKSTIRQWRSNQDITLRKKRWMHPHNCELSMF